MILLERMPLATGVLQVDGREFAVDFEQAAVSVSSACLFLRLRRQTSTEQLSVSSGRAPRIGYGYRFLTLFLPLCSITPGSS
jgi:hypothetical protein